MSAFTWFQIFELIRYWIKFPVLKSLSFILNICQNVNISINQITFALKFCQIFSKLEKSNEFNILNIILFNDPTNIAINDISESS